MGLGDDKVKRLLQTARMQIQQGERREALRTYRKALELDLENQQILDRINTVEREISAMDKFNESRSTRAHSAGRNISSSVFVDDCIKRSDEASKMGDVVRALQELERAKRHDPDNTLVQKKIRVIKRSIKINGIADIVRNDLKSNNPLSALKNIKRTFDIWPSAPVLAELLDLIEAYQPEAALEEKKREPVITQTPTPVPVTPPKKKPEKLTEEKKKTVKPVPEKKKPAPVPEPEKEKEGKNRIYYIVGAVVLLAIIVFGVIKITSGPADEPEVIEYIPPEPYTETIVVQGATDINLVLDGVPVQENSPGVFVLSDTIFNERNIEISAEGFETIILNPRFEEAQVNVDTLILDSLGTSVVQVALNYTMPEGEDDPGIDAVRFFIDGEEIEGATDSIRTGIHVFEAILEGYRVMPESVLVERTINFEHNMNILAAEQSQITLQLSSDTPGNASFFIDGSRVATGRRMTEVLPFGDYFLQVQMEEREEWAASINLGQNGYNRTISLAELILAGQLMVGPEPWSDVYVDGVHVGTTPFGGVELEPGSYSVRLSNPDFEDDFHTVEITSGETSAIQFNAVSIAGAGEDTVAVEPAEDLPISSPFAIQQTPPSVPSQARARGDLHGYVTLAVLVGTDGSVQNVTIVNDPLGLGCGQAAVDAVYNWIFSPAMQGSQPVEVTTNVQVRFDIE
ncbi:MAG: TonB family protein [Candidatus Fermentibacteraceae bacterium]|nr:TonB family protein [Candidatus Fermentibacteraceae bacterium]